MRLEVNVHVTERNYNLSHQFHAFQNMVLQDRTAHRPFLHAALIQHVTMAYVGKKTVFWTPLDMRTVKKLQVFGLMGFLGMLITSMKSDDTLQDILDGSVDHLLNSYVRFNTDSETHIAMPIFC
jgi:hypothetical protein